MNANRLLTSLISSLCLLSATQIGFADGRVSDLYAENCAGCHGDDLAGGSGSSLIDDKWINGGSDAEIAASIRDGNADMGMPAWAGGLDEKEIRSLVIFIREKGAESRLEQVNEQLGDTDGVFTAAGGAGVGSSSSSPLPSFSDRSLVSARPTPRSNRLKYPIRLQTSTNKP